MLAMSRLALLLLLLAAGSALGAEPAFPMQERLAACNLCHGEHGEGKRGNAYYPHLAGKPSGYLRAQLQAFRDGRRLYPQMNWLMRHMGDDYLDRIADYYAALPPQSSAQAIAMTQEAAEHARQLVEQGDIERGIPACVACHGADLAGVEPGVPALLGLPPDYIVAQLGAWREGTRVATAPDCMAEVARALSPSDMRRLGEWLASQGAARSLPPAPAGSYSLPVKCGDLPTAEAQP